MQYVQAFKSMGYTIPNPRGDWSAEKADGVCVTLWTKEVDWNALSIDTRINADDFSLWGHKPANRKRAKHLLRALKEFDGWFDMIKVNGIPGQGYGEAVPWNPSDRKGRVWRVTEVDPETGHFKAQAEVKP